MLTIKQKKFVEEYLQLRDQSKAYRRAYNCSNMSEATIGRNAHSVRYHPAVAAAIEKAEQIIIRDLALKAKDILKMWRDIALADPAELVSTYITRCPRCWPPELEIKDEQPNKECVYCYGKGIPRIYVTPTAQLSHRARALYAGAKHTKHGIEIIFESRAKALENIAKFIGMFDERAAELIEDIEEDLRPLSERVITPEDGVQQYLKTIRASIK